eukprot:CAMPEP_0119312670 /NCGR_PEP_ID=MMETSP1333-20130426/26944_1 /TAXON_ID=418940 /ORGANISM="Scyphosphaera apsteinii, Strain RCC1455" /LENGTH=319 /DNA_ID=CAMNT_0007317323 /DNA_START=314 /DNA_END=1270 /DNA_ORIENTATION=-
MELLGPYVAVIFGNATFPKLLPHLGPLLDELHLLEPYLSVLIKHHADLFPVLGHLVRYLRALQPYLDDLVRHIDLLAPYTSRLAPHLGTLLPHMPVLISRLPELIPHFPLFVREEALKVLLPHMSVLLASDATMLRTVALRLLDVPETTDKPKEDSPVAFFHEEPKPMDNFWYLVKKRLMPALQEPAPKRTVQKTAKLTVAQAVEVLIKLENKLDASEKRTLNLENDFRACKAQMAWRQQKHHSTSMWLCTAEGAMIEAENCAMNMRASHNKLESDAEGYARRIGVEAIDRGYARKLITNNAKKRIEQPRAKTTDDFLW